MPVQREPLRVAVVEDVPLFRDVITSAINDDPGFLLAGTAASAHEARTVLPSTAPDLLLLDLNLPDGFGFDVGMDLRRALPNMRVLILSEHVRPQVLTGLPPAEQPYWSYLLKTRVSSRAELLGALRSAMSRPLIDDRVRDSATAQDLRVEGLNDRQLEILALVAAGHSNTSIASELFMSTKSVEYHLTQIYAQLELLGDSAANSRVQAAVLFTKTEDRI